MFQTNLWGKSKYILHGVYKILQKTMVQPNRSHMAVQHRKDVICMLDNLVTHTHTFIIFNTYCFSTATMVTWTCLSVTLYIHCLSCLSSLSKHIQNSFQSSFVTNDTQALVTCNFRRFTSIMSVFLTKSLNFWSYKLWLGSHMHGRTQTCDHDMPLCNQICRSSLGLQ